MYLTLLLKTLKQQSKNNTVLRKRVRLVTINIGELYTIQLSDYAKYSCIMYSKVTRLE